MKSFTVECKTQHCAAKGWRFFATYECETKGEAVQKARDENYNGMCLSGEGLVWFRAIEIS